jgi:hypothetical protein
MQVGDGRYSSPPVWMRKHNAASGRLTTSSGSAIDRPQTLLDFD